MSAANICLVEDNPGDIYLLEKALKRYRIPYDLTCLRMANRQSAVFQRKTISFRT